jgi:hypothetical protein
MAKITVTTASNDPSSEDVTLHITGIASSKGQAALKFANDLNTALADGRLDLYEDLQLGLDLKSLLS